MAYDLFGAGRFESTEYHEADEWIELVGMRRIRAQLKEMGEDLSDLKDAHKRAAEIAAAGARELVPVRTERLKRSIRPGATKTAATVRVGSKKIAYAHAIQWGRKWWPSARKSAASDRKKHISFIKPSLFLTAGAKRYEPEWVAVFEDQLKKTLDKIEGETT